ncbi:MAG: hypothetical protein LBK52_07710, partial [Deltaproteobacteria bacterium]|nr:hypothetical protein [Deltaproteobacteria bacterium]
LKTKKQPAGQASPAVQPEAGPVPVPVPAPAPDLISAARDNFPAGQEKSPGPPKSAESPQDNKDRPAGSGPAGSGSADSGPADQKDSPAPAEEAGGLQPAAAASLTAVFIFSLLVYLGAFLAFGHVYKVWKLAAYTALPLSFLPLTLVFALLVKHLGRRPRLIRGIALTLAAAFLVQFASVKAADIPGQYFGMVSARSLVRTLRQISSDISRGSTVIVSMDSWSRNLIASIIFANNQSFKAKFTRTLFHIQPAPIDYNLLTQKTYILSDVDYKDIIRGRFESYISGRFFVYNFSRLQIQGYLALPGNELQEDRFKRYSAFNWKLGPSPVYGNMIIPRDKIGRDLTFQAEFNGPPQLPENCRRLRLGWFREGRELIWQSGQGPHFKAAVPAQDSRKGLMKFILEFDPAFQPPNPSPAEASCSYDIVNFTVK